MDHAQVFISLCSFEQLSRADAVILLEGDGYTRIQKACTLVREGWADTLVFSGGIEDLSYGSYPYEMCMARILEEGIRPESIVHESASQHTRHQAENIVALCLEKGWRHIILVATHYHQYRAFLTFLKVLEERGLMQAVRITNAPANADWFEPMPWGVRANLLREELRKVELYREKGHVSNFTTAIDYIQSWSKQ